MPLPSPLCAFCRVLPAALICVAVLTTGCGTSVVPDFPLQLMGADGTRITLEEVEEIVNDPDLTDEGKREALRTLGIGDEKLIDALLTL